MEDQAGTNQDERPAYQTRVIEEKRELDEKIAKLDAFLGTTTAVPTELLRRQSEAMKVYSGILGERLESFGIKLEG